MPLEDRDYIKGSQKWLQKLVNDHPEIINNQIIDLLNLEDNDIIHWLSPLKRDDYAEYRDSAFIDKLAITLNKRSLALFWPRRGPQWDALAKTDSGKVILIEAKAHIGELVSPGCQASPRSRAKIIESLEETKSFLHVPQKFDWAGIFYQYANRLAHLYLLRIVNDIDAYLVFIYFLNDADMGGPTTEAEWRAALKVLEASLGLRKHKLSRYMLDVFIDTKAF